MANKQDEIKEAFNIFDADGNGQLTAKEVGDVMKRINQISGNLGENFQTEQEIDDIINEIELDGVGNINFEDFQKLFIAKLSNPSTEQEINDAFKVLDKTGNGLIQIDDFKKLLVVFLQNYSEDEINEIANLADSQKSGQVNYQELVKNLFH